MPEGWISSRTGSLLKYYPEGFGKIQWDPDDNKYFFQIWLFTSGSKESEGAVAYSSRRYSSLAKAKKEIEDFFEGG